MDIRHLLRSAAGNFLIQHIQNMQLNVHRSAHWRRENSHTACEDRWYAIFPERSEISMDQDAFLPMQQLNSLRRAALDGLRREIATAFYRECNPLTTQVETFKEETENGNLNRYSVFIETEEQLETVFSFLNQKEELYGQGTQRIGRIALGFRLLGTDFSDTHVRDRIDFWRKSGVELYLYFHIFSERMRRNGLEDNLKTLIDCQLTALLFEILKLSFS